MSEVYDDGVSLSVGQLQMCSVSRLTKMLHEAADHQDSRGGDVTRHQTRVIQPLRFYMSAFPQQGGELIPRFPGVWRARGGVRYADLCHVNKTN
ncbi:hypothetical protein E2C01_044669 [Portunus trituberculatus]|uniref:Uncharacterized protein n=1 Tax=Portunus trituberculatus TaxID=210409 RepID=A0A5B7FZU4_PORTR|nr:hypothetical protein [Portunus trituberculatus]